MKSGIWYRDKWWDRNWKSSLGWALLCVIDGSLLQRRIGSAKKKAVVFHLERWICFQWTTDTWAMNQTFKQHNIFQPSQQKSKSQFFIHASAHSRKWISIFSTHCPISLLCYVYALYQIPLLFPQFYLSPWKILCNIWHCWPLHCTMNHVLHWVGFNQCSVFMTEMVRWRLSNYFGDFRKHFYSLNSLEYGTAC